LSSEYSKYQFIQDNWEKIEDLEEKFVGYLKPVSASKIEKFLRQFKKEDMPAALKLLENIDYYDNDRTSQLTNQLGRLIKNRTNNDLDQVYFCPTDSSSGSSTDMIIRKLRNELRLDAGIHNDKFIRPSELGDFALDDEPKTIVFVDDFIGSGRSFLGFWGRISAGYNDIHNYFLATVVAHQQGIKLIRKNSPIKIITSMEPIPNSEKIFSIANKEFSKDEKEILKKYCEFVETRDHFKYGFDNTQSSVIFYERSSNNILPILYSRKNGWFPLFPRRWL